jgi:hypothetical protein
MALHVLSCHQITTIGLIDAYDERLNLSMVVSV